MGLFNSIQHNSITYAILVNFKDIVLNKYAQFDGRANRAEFWQFVLVYVVLAVVFSILINLFEGVNPLRMIFMTLSIILMLVLLVPWVALSVRRMHDVGKSGKWIFINLVPIIGTLWFLILAITVSQPGINRFEQQ